MDQAGLKLKNGSDGRETAFASMRHALMRIPAAFVFTIRENVVKRWLQRIVAGVLAGSFLLCAGCDRSLSDMFKFSGDTWGGLLYNGQPEGAVVSILGEPRGRVNFEDEVNLLYPGGSLKFKEGLLFGLTPELEKTVIAAAQARMDRPLVKVSWQDRLLRFFSDIHYRKYLVPGKVTVVAFYAEWLDREKQAVVNIQRVMLDEQDVVVRQVPVPSPDSSLFSEFKLTSLPQYQVLDRNAYKVGLLCSDEGEVEASVLWAKKGLFERIFSFWGPDPRFAPLLSKGQVTVVYFYAEWNGACKMYSPVISGLVLKHKDVALHLEDMGPRTSSKFSRYGISSIPSVMVFDAKGRQVGGVLRQPDEIDQAIRKAR